MPVVGSLLVQLGLVMGVFDAEQIVSLPYNSRLCPKPHAQEWCVSCNKCALRGLHACVCRRPCFCVSARTAASLHVFDSVLCFGRPPCVWCSTQM